jgi:hypothetical protein
MAMAMSLVASTRGLALMPAYANNLLHDLITTPSAPVDESHRPAKPNTS